MKLISLNTWGGRLYDHLLSFISQYRNTTDLFCFQEVFESKTNSTKPTSDPEVIPDLYQRLANQLQGFHGYVTGPYSDWEERLSIFTSKSTMTIDDHGDFFLCEPMKLEVDGRDWSVGSKLQWVTVKHSGEVFTVGNVHGIWLPNGKRDSPERINQSKRIVEFLENSSGAKVLCGDLNLLPETQSVRILEANMINLIRKYKVTSTRSSLYDPRKEKFADYIFTSPQVRVSDFKVLNEEVSDHLALMLRFD